MLENSWVILRLISFDSPGFIQKLNINYCGTFVEAKYFQTLLWSINNNTCSLNSVKTKFVNYVL